MSDGGTLWVDPYDPQVNGLSTNKHTEELHPLIKEYGRFAYLEGKQGKINAFTVVPLYIRPHSPVATSLENENGHGKVMAPTHWVLLISPSGLLPVEGSLITCLSGQTT